MAVRECCISSSGLSAIAPLLHCPCAVGGQVPHALIATEMHVKLTPSAVRFNLHSTPAAEKVLRACNACQWWSDVSPVSNGIFFCLFAGWVTADGLDRHVDTAPACITRLHHQSHPLSPHLSLLLRAVNFVCILLRKLQAVKCATTDSAR